MPDTLTFLHTSSIDITTFDAQTKDQAPDIRGAHLVGEDVLTEAREYGIAAALKSTIVPTIEFIFDATARVEKKFSGSKPYAKKPGHTSKRKTNSSILRKSQSACDKSQTWTTASSSPSPQWPRLPLPAPTDQYRYYNSPALGVAAAVTAFRQ